MKTKSISAQLTHFQFLFLLVFAVLLLGVIGFLLTREHTKPGISKRSLAYDTSLTNEARHVPVNDIASSNNNKRMLLEAESQRDEMICNGIKGSINYTRQQNDGLGRSPAEGVALTLPAMTESDARKYCINQVRSIIDQQNFEKKVCSDTTVQEYQFESVTFPCPSRQ
jgi:hypothetical protein